MQNVSTNGDGLDRAQPNKHNQQREQHVNEFVTMRVRSDLDFVSRTVGLCREMHLRWCCSVPQGELKAQTDRYDFLLDQVDTGVRQECPANACADHKTQAEALELQVSHLQVSVVVTFATELIERSGLGVVWSQGFEYSRSALLYLQPIACGEQVEFDGQALLFKSSNFFRSSSFRQQTSSTMLGAYRTVLTIRVARWLVNISMPQSRS